MLNKRFPMTLLSVLVLLAMALAACTSAEKETPAPTGKKITEMRDLASFSVVEMTLNGSLTIRQGDKESITIETDDNLMDLITTKVLLGKLTIGFARGYDIRCEECPVLELTLIKLDGIISSGLGSIRVIDLDTESLDIRSDGLGSITIDGAIVENKIDIDSSSLGAMDLKDIKAKEISTDISGLGGIKVSGEVDVQSVRLDGLGTYDAEDLKSRDCTVKVDVRNILTDTDSSLCVVTVYVTEELDVILKTDADSPFNVCYKGNPEVTQDVIGGGSVNKIQ